MSSIFLADFDTTIAPVEEVFIVLIFKYVDASLTVHRPKGHHSELECAKNIVGILSHFLR